MRGYFGIGIENTKTKINIGTLWRSAYLFDAAFIFTIKNRYKKQCSDTQNTWKHIPLINYTDLKTFKDSLPYSCKIIGVELIESAIPIKEFKHPERCIYLLGAEDHGLTKEAFSICHEVIKLPGEISMNVATAGSIIMYDRLTKE